MKIHSVSEKNTGLSRLSLLIYSDTPKETPIDVPNDFLLYGGLAAQDINNMSEHIIYLYFKPY